MFCFRETIRKLKFACCYGQYHNTMLQNYFWPGLRSHCSNWSGWRCTAPPEKAFSPSWSMVIIWTPHVPHHQHHLHHNNPPNQPTPHKPAPAPVNTNHNHHHGPNPTFPVRLAPRGIPTATSRRSPSPLNSPGINVFCCWQSYWIIHLNVFANLSDHAPLIWFYQLLLNSQGRSRRPGKIGLNKKHNWLQCSA